MREENNDKREIKGAMAALFFLAIIFNTLAAYEFLKVPLPWLAYALMFLLLINTHKIRRGAVSAPRGSALLIVYILLAILANLVGLVFGQATDMPPGATSSYPVFIAARFLVLFGFMTTFFAVYNCCLVYKVESVYRIVKCAFVFVVCSAFYIYIAQILDWWEPVRSRVGTGGQDFRDQAVTFTYGFHRALGTFREPSHLAEWIIGPLLIMLVMSPHRIHLREYWLVAWAFLIIVLSGSLLGVLGLIGGLAILVATPWIRITRRFSFVLIGAGVIIAGNALFNIEFLDVIAIRLGELLVGGVEGTNRAYIWDYVKSEWPPVLGYGVGNSNIVLTEYRGSSLMSSHLSFFVNSWYSLGFFGILLAIVFVMRPFIDSKVLKYAKQDRIVAGCLAAVGAWFVFYLGNSEEPSFAHALLLGLLFGRCKEIDIRRRGEVIISRGWPTLGRSSSLESCR